MKTNKLCSVLLFIACGFELCNSNLIDSSKKWLEIRNSNLQTNLRGRQANSGFIVNNDQVSNHFHDVILVNFDSNITNIEELIERLEEAFNIVDKMMFDLDYLIKDIIIAIDDAWLIITGISVFLLLLGYAILEAGTVEGKSVKSVLMINLVATVFGGIVWYAIGYALFHGDGEFIAANSEYFFTNEIKDFGLFFHSAGYAITSVIIVSGSILGRIRFESYLAFSLLFLAYVYPIAGHVTWEGYLSNFGYIDFAGSMVTHGLAGISCLTGAWLVGPRVGRFYPLKPGQKYKTVRPLKSNSTILVYLGASLVFVNWFYYNGGQSLGLVTGLGHYAASKAIMNSFVSSFFSLATMVLYELAFKETREVEKASNALIAGLVAIGAGAALVSTTDAMVIGSFAALLYNYASYWTLHVMEIDDPLDNFAVHGVCGAYGALVVGFFSETDGLFHGHDSRLLLTQTKGVLMLSVWGSVNAVLIFTIVKYTIGLTVSKEEQAIGLDLINHDAAFEELDATQVQEYALRKDMENKLIQQRKKDRESREKKRESGQTTIMSRIKQARSSVRRSSGARESS